MCTLSGPFPLFRSAISHTSFAWLANTFSRKALNPFFSDPSTKTPNAAGAARRPPPSAGPHRPNSPRSGAPVVSRARAAACLSLVVQGRLSSQPLSTDLHLGGVVWRRPLTCSWFFFMASHFLIVLPSLIGSDAVESPTSRLWWCGRLLGSQFFRRSAGCRRSGIALIQKQISGLHICLTTYRSENIDRDARPFLYAPYLFVFR